MLLAKLTHRFSSLASDFRWRLETNQPESVYFYTLHKCASSLFSGYVLSNIDGLRHVNYARQIYRGRSVGRLTFKKTGHVYGPIRLSADRASPVYRLLVEPASNLAFIEDKIAIFLVRDPRDILVSSYYSFGYTHGFSAVAEIQARQMALRNQIQAKTIDSYALDSADAILQNLEAIDKLSRGCERSIVIKYEDLINRFEYFIHQLTLYLNFNNSVRKQIFERSRPKQNENTSSHRRSGLPGGFRNKLNDETITSLNTKFKGVLRRFEYEE
jgi:hypothetical protein